MQGVSMVLCYELGDFKNIWLSLRKRGVLFPNYGNWTRVPYSTAVQGAVYCIGYPPPPNKKIIIQKVFHQLAQ